MGGFIVKWDGTAINKDNKKSDVTPTEFLQPKKSTKYLIGKLAVNVDKKKSLEERVAVKVNKRIVKNSAGFYFVTDSSNYYYLED